MKFTVNKKPFYQAVQNIIGVVPVKTTIPILGNILVDLQGNELSLTGTDLEVSISTKIEVQGDQDGAVAIPAKVLYEIVRELPEIPIAFECDDEFKISLKTDKGFYKLSGVSKEDFPKIVVEGQQDHVTINAQLFNGIINKTIFAVSTDELRTTLMGVLLKISDEQLRLVSTDGHRLVKIDLKNFKSNLNSEAIVPTKALNLVSKNLNDTEEIKVRLSEDHIVFVLGETVIYSKGIEGQFPNYDRVIPVDNDKTVILNRELLNSSVRRVAIFSNSITHQIRLSVSSGQLKIKSEDIEFGGEAEETIDTDYNYDDLDVGYNANYLLDILRHLDTDEIILKVKDQISAGIIYPTNQKENEDILMLLMPIRLNED